MKLPPAIESITLTGRQYERPYPPLGFHPFCEHELGNGDQFGLYWPIGREDHEPIVAETYHDEGSIQPKFSSLARFLTVAQAVALGEDDDGEFYDEASYVEGPEIEDDPQSPTACVEAAGNCLKRNEVDEAIQWLSTAVAVVPEYGKAQALLATQYRRIGDHDSAVRSAAQALISPPSFGGTSPQLAAWLSKQTACPEDLETDPIWNNRSRLTFRFGGVTENDQYEILRNAIEEYLQAENYIPAMTLMQTYGELMFRETVSFMERNGFDVEQFCAWQKDVASEQYGRSRILAADPR